MIYFLIAIIVLIAFILYQLIELNRFTVKTVDINGSSDMDFIFLSDIHGKTYGKVSDGKSRLLNKIKELQPKCIIIGGDAVSKKKPEQYEIMKTFVSALCEISNVYYLFGNHETYLEKYDTERFNEYINELKACGVIVSRNEVFFPFENDSVSCYAMELPLEYYKKGKDIPFSDTIITAINKQWEAKGTKILFSHQPAYADDYMKCDVDAIFSGHTHGGLVRIPGIGSVMNPEFKWWPKYGGGVYELGEQKTKLVVSHGLGTHHIHLRVFNSAQLIYGRIFSCKDKEN